MKTTTVGLVLAAILMVLAGVGFGIAQAAGDYSEGSALCCVDQEAIEQDSTTSSQEAPEWANPSAEDTHMASPTETGSLPDGKDDSSDVESNGFSY